MILDANFNTIFSIVRYLMIIAIVVTMIVTFIKSKEKMAKAKTIKREDGTTVTAKDLARESKFVSENRSKYESIMDSNDISLTREKYQVKEYQNKAGVFALLIFVEFFLGVSINTYFFIAVPFTVIFLIVYIKKANSSPYATEKNAKYSEVVTNILKEYDSNIDYYPKEGLKYEEYRCLYFPEQCDRYFSEDAIVNQQKGFFCSDVTIESEHEDSDDHTYYVTEYNGTIARIDIKNIGCTIILGGLGSNSFSKNKEFNEIVFENEEFNDLFICFSNNEFMAYKLLTPNIMEEFVRIKKNTLGDIDIRIINDKLYIRFKETNGFDVTWFDNEKDKENLFKSVAVLEEIIKTMDIVKNIIDEKNV